MFAVVYKFKIHSGREDDFLNTWADLTEFIKKHEGGLGSRMHKVDATTFYAYAQWPSKEAWENSGGKLPDEALKTRDLMRQCIAEVSTEIKMDVIKDLLITP